MNENPKTVYEEVLSGAAVTVTPFTKGEQRGVQIGLKNTGGFAPRIAFAICNFEITGGEKIRNGNIVVFNLYEDRRKSTQQEGVEKERRFKDREGHHFDSYDEQDEIIILKEGESLAVTSLRLGRFHDYEIDGLNKSYIRDITFAPAP